jgi:hypothetical protein
VPEVVVSEPAPQDLELRRALAIVVAAVSWAIWHFVLG